MFSSEIYQRKHGEEGKEFFVHISILYIDIVHCKLYIDFLICILIDQLGFEPLLPYCSIVSHDYFKLTPLQSHVLLSLQQKI